jgi:hypothetical protein
LNYFVFDVIHVDEVVNVVVNCNDVDDIVVVDVTFSNLPFKNIIKVHI